VPAQALRIRDASKRQFFRISEDPLNFTIKQAQLSKQRFTKQPPSLGSG
jgi:hypothetical protein